MRPELHMHQIKNFIDDRYCYGNNIDPRFYRYKGVQNAFLVGNAVDHAIKAHYIGGELYAEDFRKLKTKINQVEAQSTVENYIDIYKEEYFHSWKEVTLKIPLNKYTIVARPDLMALTYFENETVIVEIKTAAEGTDPGEALDFQTMLYCWASYRWNFKIPIGVIKRTLMKTRIKKKKAESENDYIERLACSYGPKQLKSVFRPVNIEMIYEFEKYLSAILIEMDKAKKYNYYKKSTDYWGI